MAIGIAALTILSDNLSHLKNLVAEVKKFQDLTSPQK